MKYVVDATSSWNGKTLWGLQSIKPIAVHAQGASASFYPVSLGSQRDERRPWRAQRVVILVWRLVDCMYVGPCPSRNKCAPCPESGLGGCVYSLCAEPELDDNDAGICHVLA